MNNKFRNTAYVLLGLIFLYFFFLGINLPYVGPNATNFNDYSLIAKNYNLFGFWNTKFAEIVSVTKTLPANPQYYLHHPPLLPILEALTFRIFGYGFWVGRLTVILFSLGSIFLIYFISKKLLNKKYALISAFVYAYIPASTIFGKMIGQEPLVLFFSLSTILFVLRYLSTKSKLDFILIITSLIFGTLSDWPMVYFSLLISIYLFQKKEIKLSLTIFLTAFVVAALFLSYIYHFMSGFSDISSAILIRSLGQLVGQPFWPLRWMSILLIRMLVYFNPIFVMLGFYYLFTNIFKFSKVRKENRLLTVILILFAFGLIHILLYPEGSFGHPYWIYYLIPFITFSSSFVLYKLLKRNKFVFITIILFVFLFMIPVQYWKYEQIISNVWRYSLAKQVNLNFLTYESIEINSGSVIDRDLIKYAFSHDVKIINNISEINEGEYKHFLYSCTSNCLISDKIFAYLLDNYKGTRVSNSDGEAYVFELKTKRVTGNIEINLSNMPVNADQKSQSGGKIGNIYRILKDLLNAPQI